MAKAVGMIETLGPAASIAVADAMLKSADVMLVKQEEVSQALYTILVEGELSAVQAAVETGKRIAEKLGALIAFQVIANPDEGTRKLF
ncbi:carboxysome shell protein [Pueribacillus theae]|uniref:Carboxysome shell protein n=1 Tax=Pueribacillus theae TaxID=2171751 RepID=A0A2U1K653_9BACI|nr:BMC domain-containing protein [Pueribacillus theae]PWA13021.1 carboxysome shell protein [Pueribacillus theae]